MLIDSLLLFTLLFSLLTIIFGGWWTIIKIRYGWASKSGLTQIFKILNKVSGKKFLLWSIRILTWCFIMAFMAIVYLTVIDPWGINYLTVVNQHPSRVTTPIGDLTSENETLWLLTLIFGVVGIKASALIMRLIKVLINDILVVGKRGKWGPSGDILYTYRYR